MRVQRGRDVSVRGQLVAQLSMGVLEGRFAPGQPLPSTRELARRVRVHRNTVRAAYGALARQGLVRLRPGSGVYPRAPGVRRPAAARETEERPEGRVGRGSRGRGNATGHAGIGPGEGPDAGLRRWRAGTRERGRPRTWARDVALRWAREAARRRVTVTGPAPEVRGLRAAELREALPGWEVEVRDPDALAARPCRPGRGLVVCGPALRDELARGLPPWQEIACLRPASGRRERRLLQRLPGGSVLLVLSACRPVVERIRALRAALRGEEVALRCCTPGHPRAAAWLRMADAVLADRLSLERREEGAARLPSAVAPVHLQAPSALRDLAAYLGGGPPVA